jgi:hypothetical protein
MRTLILFISILLFVSCDNHSEYKNEFIGKTIESIDEHATSTVIHMTDGTAIEVYSTSAITFTKYIK